MILKKFKDVAFISFRGSQTVGDWINNFDIRMVHTPFGDIHKGFVASLNSVSKYQIQKIEATFDKPYAICLVGHSRGGALAVLTAAILKDRGYEPVAIYTFGQPKVGGKTFVKWWEENMNAYYLRVINRSDIVPYLPPELDDIPLLILAILKIIVWSCGWIIGLPFRVAIRLIRRVVPLQKKQKGNAS